jgi:hypothetical protein
MPPTQNHINDGHLHFIKKYLTAKIRRNSTIARVATFL